ncbi:RNA polymerase sigma factor [Conexibacter sp. DBS9H8]|uniref:RNA polymerase sigma factor n=1 Tax=Conexibacter sp. DBS9H8 TaxID=2937801 RepID=UPI00200BE039|nr:sigma-70 family RNA polymerase sigma factor [Conexibacter sp. DBS9H8]
MNESWRSAVSLKVKTEAETVAGLRGRNSQEATRALYRTYGAELYGFAVRRLGDAGLAEELVQDVFTRAWHHSDRYEPARASVRTWLYAIARNALIDAERRRGRRPPVQPGEHPGDPADPDEPIETALLRHQIHLAVSRLTADHRQVIQLVHFRGLSLVEVAELTHLPVGTVKSRLHYASANLRLALQELEVLP